MKIHETKNRPGNRLKKFEHTIKRSLKISASVLASLCLCFLLQVSSVQAEVKEVTNAELTKLRDSGAVLIDIRRPDEWAYSGIIEGSHLLTFFDVAGRYDIEGWVNALRQLVPANEPFVLICEVGGRSGSVSRLLDKRLGIPAVHNLTRGIRSWIAEGREVVPHKP